MPSFETPGDIFTRLSVFDSPKGSSLLIFIETDIHAKAFNEKVQAV